MSRRLLVAAIAAAAAAPFTLFIYEAPAELALRAGDGPATADYWGAYAAFAETAGAPGVLRGGSALHTGEEVATLRDGATEPVALATPALALGGYFQLDVNDMAAAIDWARRLPASRSGAVEIRAGYPAPGM